MNLSLKFRDQLPPAVAMELEQLVGAINTTWAAQHKPDGSHRGITADGDIVAEGSARFKGQLRCRVLKSAAQSIADSTETNVTFDKPILPEGFLYQGYDNDQMFGADGTGLYVRPSESGLYLVTANISFASNATGYRKLTIKVSTTDKLAQIGVPAVNGSSTVLQCSLVVPIDLDNLPNGALPILVNVFQTSGGALDVQSSDFSWLQVTKIG